jgi:quercetin dioxygenase-like cupin family protein
LREKGGETRRRLHDPIGKPLQEALMQKIKLANVPLIPWEHPDLTQVCVRTLISRDASPSHRGMLSIAEFAPGGSHKLHRYARSARISHLIAGQGEHLTENGPVPIHAGDATYIPKNTWHGFRNTGTHTAVLLSLYSPATTLIEAGYETHEGDLDRSKPPHVAKTGLAELQGDAALDEEAGFLGLGVFWLATRDTVGTDDFLLGASTFEPGGLHEHHRHPHGDEFLYILEGEGEHLTPDGAISLCAGEIAYIPANEYHGFKNKEGVLTRTLFGYFGAATLAEAGYEVRAPAGN